MRAIVLALLAVVAVITPATAEIRHVSLADPADQQPTVNNKPSGPDISNVDVTYDTTAGTITFTTSYYGPVNEYDPSITGYAWWDTFSVGQAPTSSYSATCSTPTGSLAGQSHVFSNYVNFYNQANVSGYEGKLALTRTESSDRKTISVTASSSLLANRDLRCVDFTQHARFRSTVENLNSRYDEGCNCWYVTGDDDLTNVKQGEAGSKAFYFDGYAPTPTPTVTPSPSPTVTATVTPADTDYTVPKPAKPKRLTKAQANARTIKVLKARFKSFRQAFRFDNWGVTCSRDNNTEFSCSPSWGGNGGPGVGGTVHIRNRIISSKQAWQYAYTLKRGCRGVEGKYKRTCKPKRYRSGWRRL